MKHASLIVIFSLVIATGVAQEVDLSDEEMEQAQEYVNSFSDDLPGFLKSIVGDQRINANIETENETVTYSAITEGVTVENLSRERLEDPTLVVNTSREAIEDVYEANNSAQEVRNQVNEGEIEYESYGMFNQLKTFVMDLFF